MKLNIATSLTLARILSVPLFVLFFYLPFESARILTAGLFFLAGLTDWLDGYLARRLHQATRFGAFLDPVADKLMVIVALVLLVGEFGAAYLALPAAVIICREILISALREWMAEIGKRTSVAVSFVAKIKTMMQMAAIFVLLICRADEFPYWKLFGVALLYVASGLTLWSMIVYLKAAWADLTFAKET